MFRFYLHNGNQYYRIGMSGSVEKTNVPTPIATPDGWADTEISWGRNIDYWGVFRSFTTPYEFVEDGAKILRHLYYKGDEPLSPFGIEAVCSLKIEIQNGLTTAWEPYYSGNIDFSQFKDSDFFVRVNIMESGLRAYLTAYVGTNYNIPLNAQTGLQVRMDGIRLKALYKFITVRTDIKGVLSRGIAYFSKNFGFAIREGSFQSLTPRDTGIDSGYTIAQSQPMNVGDFLPNWFRDRFYLTSNRDNLIERIRIREQIEIRNKSTSDSDALKFRIRVVVSNVNSIITYTQVVWSYANLINKGSTTNTGVIDFSTPAIRLEDGDRMHIFYELQTLDPIKYVDISYFAIDGNQDDRVSFFNDFEVAFRLNASSARGMRLHDLFNKLCQQLSENTGGGTSSFLSNPSIEVYNNKPFNTIATSGDSLRQLSIPQPPAIRTSLQEFFQAQSSIYGLGIGIEGNQYRMEPLSYFMNPNTIIADLGEVSEFESEPAGELMFNSLKIGYQDYSYDEVNGLDEYNTGHEYKLPIKTISKAADKISPYRTDAFGIETYRANLTDKTTTDAEADNDTFLIEVENTQTSGAFNIRRQNGIVLGVIYPETRYNYGLSPKRNFWRNGGLLRSVCHGLGNRQVTYQVSKKNNRMVSSFAPFPNPPQIAESANVSANSLPPALFIPILFRFRCTPPDNIAALMATNPRGCFKFAWKGETYKGFPMTVGTKPATYDSYDMTLLCTPDTDITKLIS